MREAKIEWLAPRAQLLKVRRAQRRLLAHVDHVDLDPHLVHVDVVAQPRRHRECAHLNAHRRALRRRGRGRRAARRRAPTRAGRRSHVRRILDPPKRVEGDERHLERAGRPLAALERHRHVRKVLAVREQLLEVEKALCHLLVLAAHARLELKVHVALLLILGIERLLERLLLARARRDRHRVRKLEVEGCGRLAKVRRHERGLVANVDEVHLDPHLAHFGIRLERRRQVECAHLDADHLGRRGARDGALSEARALLLDGAEHVCGQRRTERLESDHAHAQRAHGPLEALQSNGRTDEVELLPEQVGAEVERPLPHDPLLATPRRGLEGHVHVRALGRLAHERRLERRLLA